MNTKTILIVLVLILFSLMLIAGNPGSVPSLPGLPLDGRLITLTADIENPLLSDVVINEVQSTSGDKCNVGLHSILSITPMSIVDDGSVVFQVAGQTKANKFSLVETYKTTYEQTFCVPFGEYNAEVKIKYPDGRISSSKTTAVSVQ